jgi:hypothetical protein
MPAAMTARVNTSSGSIDASVAATSGIRSASIISCHLTQGGVGPFVPMINSCGGYRLPRQGHPAANHPCRNGQPGDSLQLLDRMAYRDFKLDRFCL